MIDVSKQEKAIALPRRSIRRRLYVLIALVLTPVILSLGWYNLHTAKRHLETSQSDDARFALSRADSALSSVVEGVKDISDFVATNRNIDMYFETDGQIGGDTLNALVDLNEVAHNLVVSNPGIRAFALYDIDSSEPYTIIRDSNISFYKTSNVLSHSIRSFIDDKEGGYFFFADTPQNPIVIRSGYYNLLFLSRLLRHPSTFRAEGYLFLGMDQGRLFDLMMEGVNSSIYSILVTDSSQNPILGDSHINGQLY